MNEWINGYALNNETCWGCGDNLLRGESCKRNAGKLSKVVHSDRCLDKPGRSKYIVNTGHLGAKAAKWE